MRLAWVTDIHLNFLTDRAAEAFCAEIGETGTDAILVGGDIGEAPSLLRYLDLLEARIARPIYLVLGNHDFYGGSIQTVRAAVSRRCAGARWLTWLNERDVIELTEDTGLIGHDGWADGRLGTGHGSRVELNDYHLIEDFDGVPLSARFARLRALGDEAAAHVRRVLPLALGRFRRLIFLTHVPPFRAACWHEGRISDDDFLPHFTCKAVGDVLIDAMRAHPDQELLVLCGHTHGSGVVNVLPNLPVLTGGAEYGRPRIQRPLITL